MCFESCHAVARQLVGIRAGFESQSLVIQYAITVMDEHAAILRHSPSVKISKLTYLDLGHPVPLGALGDEKPPSSRSMGIRRAPCQLTPISSRSSYKVLRHISLFLRSSSGTQCIAVCAGLSCGSRRTWPAIFIFLVLTMSWSRSVPVLLITSSFVTWSLHEMPSIAPRRRR